MTKYLMLVALVAVFPTTWAIDAGCDYYQDLVAGTTYYVYSPGYPNLYTGPRSCRWYAKSPTNIKFSCQTFSTPSSNNCVGDRLAVSPSGDLQLADARNYCGTGTFEVTSNGNYMNIVFTALAGSRGGRFLCSLQATTAPTPTCNCGWKKQMRIVGGVETGVNEYPMMAGLVNMNLGQVYCGATIISTKHVVTAAHCWTRDITLSQMGVLVGDHNLISGTETSAAKLLRVSRFDRHPSYNVDTQANDIAVVTTAENIVFNMEVGPACLPFQKASTTFVGNKVDVLGWGTTEFAGATSDVLQKVQLDITTLTTCQRTFPTVTNDQVCTYTPGKDACQFDSGGPLLWQNPNTMRVVLAGIVSYGSSCADTTPGVNTRVGAFLDFIISYTPGVTYCNIE